MAELDTIDQALLGLIQRDLKEDSDATYNRDALGATIYLYFLLKNKIASVELDRLIDWTNEWVDNILNKQLFSRFVDRELTSGLFGYYTLKIHSKLRTQVDDHKAMNELLDRFGEDNAFFGNLTYTIIILLSVNEWWDNISSFPPTLNWVKQQMDNGRIFNDGKNIVFASMLFEKIDPERNQRLIKMAFQKFQDQNIPFNEQIYFAWLLWNYKSHFDKKDIPKIREFVESTLNNMRPVLRQDQRQKGELESEYGSERNEKISKIVIGVYLDLLRSYSSDTIRVEKSELESVSWLTRLGAIISIGFFVLDYFIGYIAVKYNLLEKIPLTNGTGAAITVLISDLVIVTIIVALGTAGGSIFYDTILKGVRSKTVILSNLSARESEHIKLILLGGVIAGLFTAFLL